MVLCPGCDEPIAESGDGNCPNCSAKLEPVDPSGGSKEAQSEANESTPVVADGGRQQGLLSFAFEFPRRRGWKPLLIGGGLFLISFLIVPYFLILGYSYRVGRAAAIGHNEPPAFGDWGGLAFDGLRMFALVLILGIPATILQLVGAQISPILGIVLSLAVGLALPAFQVAFLGSGSITGALTDGRATSILFTTYYLKALLLSILLGIATTLLFLLSIITIVGWLFVLAFVVFVAQAFWGYVYFQAAQKGIVSRAVPV
jgi:hypothetical protein